MCQFAMLPGTQQSASEEMSPMPWASSPRLPKAVRNSANGDDPDFDISRSVGLEFHEDNILNGCRPNGAKELSCLA